MKSTLQKVMEKAIPRVSLNVGLMRVIFILLLTSSTLVSVARGSSKQVWLDYNPGWKISEKTRFALDLGLRKQIQDQGYLRLVLNPGLDTRVNKFKFAAGVANFLTLNEVVDDRLEIRPYQSVSVIWPNRRVSLDHRVRLEERFDFNTTTWDSKNSLRGRYRLRLRYRLAAYQEDRFWSLTASGEIFSTLAGLEGQHRETTRVALGAERIFKHGRRLRCEVTWQQQGLVYDPDVTADLIFLRIRFLRSW